MKGPHPLDNGISACLGQALPLLRSKYDDYGPDTVATTGTVGVATRLVDKCQRIRSLAGREANHEGEDQTWLDIVNYGIIGWMMWRGMWPQSESREPSRLVYLACPIDHANAITAGMIAADDAIAELAKCGLSCYVPVFAFGWTKATCDSPAIAAINAAALARADGLLAILPAGVVTYGTIAEIEAFRVTGKPLAVVATGDHARSVYLDNLKSGEGFCTLESACLAIANRLGIAR